MDEFVLSININKFRSTNAMWNKLMLNDPWSVGCVSTLIETENWKSKEQWEETYYASGEARHILIERDAAKLGYSKAFFDDISVLHDKSKYYSLSWNVKNINTQKGRTKEDLRRKGEILYDAVKDNGYGLTVEECVECVRYRVICETWNGIIVRENNTVKTLQQLFPVLTFEKAEGEIDYIYAVDYQVYLNDILKFAIQIKPQSYFQNAPYLVKVRCANKRKYAAYQSKFRVPIFTVSSSSRGEILNTEILDKIRRTIL